MNFPKKIGKLHLVPNCKFAKHDLSQQQFENIAVGIYLNHGCYKNMKLCLNCAAKK